jgi:ATP-dependent Clp protease adaptor protein ClpS
MKNEADRDDENDLEPNGEMCAPALYQVVLRNDDFTPIEFVVSLLEKFFYMDRHQAAAKTFEVHAIGKAVCGIFIRDFAEAKVAQIIDYAELHDHPLNCSMEVA